MARTVEEVVIGVQAKLLQFIQKEPPKSHHVYKNSIVSWSWVCVQLLELISIYPSGVTETIIISQLHSQYLKTKGWLNATTALKHKKYCSVSEVLDFKAVSSESIMEVKVDSLHTLPGTTTKMIHLVDVGAATPYLEMYLHRKFYDTLSDLKCHCLRMTGLRLVSRSGVSSQSAPLRLLPSEHVVMVLEPDKDAELLDKFESLCEVCESSNIHHPQYIRSVSAKVTGISSEEVVHSPDGTAFRRLVVDLDASLDQHEQHARVVPLVLWDSYIQFVRLFDKWQVIEEQSELEMGAGESTRPRMSSHGNSNYAGKQSNGDVLYMDHPYAKPCTTVGNSRSDASFCLELGPATMLSVVPYKPQLEILPSQRPNSVSTIAVKRAEDGRLDFSSNPDRVLIADVLPGMMNTVMLVRCEELAVPVANEEVGGEGEVRMCEAGDERTVSLQVADHTASCKDLVTVTPENSRSEIEVMMYGFRPDTFKHVLPSQLLVLTGLSSKLGRGGHLHLTCDARSAGKLTNVSCLQGWLLSPCVCVHMPLGELTTNDTWDCHFIARARLKEWNLSCGCGVEEWPEKTSGVLQTKHNIRYAMGALFWDSSGTLEAHFTSDTAESLLQVSPDEFKQMQDWERLERLSSFISIEMTFCISKVTGKGYQINSLVT